MLNPGGSTVNQNRRRPSSSFRRKQRHADAQVDFFPVLSSLFEIYA